MSICIHTAEKTLFCIHYQEQKKNHNYETVVVPQFRFSSARSPQPHRSFSPIQKRCWLYVLYSYNTGTRTLQHINESLPEQNLFCEPAMLCINTGLNINFELGKLIFLEFNYTRYINYFFNLCVTTPPPTPTRVHPAWGLKLTAFAYEPACLPACILRKKKIENFLLRRQRLHCIGLGHSAAVILVTGTQSESFPRLGIRASFAELYNTAALARGVNVKARAQFRVTRIRATSEKEKFSLTNLSTCIGGRGRMAVQNTDTLFQPFRRFCYI